MAHHDKFPRMIRLAILLAVLAGTARPGPAEAQSAASVRDTVAATLDLRGRTQQQEDSWAKEKDDLVRRYHQARDRIGWLEGRCDVQGRRVDAVEARVAELERRLREADRLESSLQDTLQVILERLETSVAQSLPFLTDEREFRLRTLREDLARPDLAAAEKLRRLLEALQVETGYGSTVEVYQDRITVDGTPIYADILRLGRVALFWMTPDRRDGGIYDPGLAAWVAVDGSRRRRIALAMDMARRRRPTELIDLPVGRVASPEQGS